MVGGQEIEEGKPEGKRIEDDIDEDKIIDKCWGPMLGEPVGGAIFNGVYYWRERCADPCGGDWIDDVDFKEMYYSDYYDDDQVDQMKCKYLFGVNCYIFPGILWEKEEYTENEE